MQLSRTETELFYRLFGALLMHVNLKARLIPPIESLDAFKATEPKLCVKLRDHLYQHPELFDEFLERDGLAGDDGSREIVAGWRDHRVGGVFYVFRHLKRHSIFLSETNPMRAYGVLGLTDPLELMVPDVPYRLSTILLPFRGRIIYDGFLTTSGPVILFGPGFRRNLEESYREAKAMHGVITSLPPPAEPSAACPESKEQRLRSLMKSDAIQRLYWEDILLLREESSELERVYQEERGKADARRLARRLREAGVTEGWFAFYEGLILASAPSVEALRRRVREILPPDRGGLPYLYHLKRKR